MGSQTPISTISKDWQMPLKEQMVKADDEYAEWLKILAEDIDEALKIAKLRLEIINEAKVPRMNPFRVNIEYMVKEAQKAVDWREKLAKLRAHR